ncbi:MAG TPA: 30S ribosomal protein S21 [Dehalococcoidia bacterium]|nr:30S ribosomal protein S21 [Dehalococcoidia bacterium]
MTEVVVRDNERFEKPSVRRKRKAVARRRKSSSR